MKLISNGPPDAAAILVLAHGAGAGMDTPFMDMFASELGELGIHVFRFEFDYMAERRKTGRKRPPDRTPKLLACFNDVINRALGSRTDTHLFIGGKSMGGRMASMITAEEKQPVKGCICLGYPFHPPGRHENLRLDHFANLSTPLLICQGERDPFGTKAEVAMYDLPDCVELHWLADGEHSFKPRKASGVTLEENIASAVERTRKFIEALC